MKFFKRTLTIVLTVVIFVLSLPTVSAFSNNKDIDLRYGRKLLGNMENGSNFQKVYDLLVSGCGIARSEITIDTDEFDIAIDDINTVFPLFYNDYPEYFWLNGGYEYITKSNDTLLTLKPKYTMTGAELITANILYNLKVEQLTNNLYGTDYDKAKTLHDRLIKTVEYKFGNNHQTAYGALVEGEAVCNGYARAYQHLMNSVGIPTWYISGTSINPATEESVAHAWNIVKLDGKWYYTDVTWDDQGSDTFYAYFNVTEKQILKDHKFDKKYINYLSSITANSTDANYYVKEDSCFYSYDHTKLITLLKKGNNKAQIYLNCDISSFFDSLNSDLLQIGKELGGTGFFDISYKASLLDSAIILDFDITPGEIYTNTWVKVGNTWYYCDKSGAIVTGWACVGGTWYYFDTSGAMQTGWLNDNGTWYYMNSSGAMATGWLNDNGTWYYMNSSGAMATGWLNDNGTWYYMNSSGAMATGWLNDNGTWYYMNSSGTMATDWLNLGGTWYYMNSSGVMQTGWLNLGGTWYYMSQSGSMLTDWQLIGGYWYYFYSGGNMASNCWIGNYWLTASGAMA